MINRVALYLNFTLSIIFIGITFFGAFVAPTDEPTSVYIILFLFFGFGSFLLFDILYYRVLARNKEKLPISSRINRFGGFIFALGIVALCAVLFMSLAALYAYLSNPEAYDIRQRSFFVGFLVSILICGISFILVMVGYSKAKKENRQIMNSYVDDIGTSG